ncbi:hypothetical protein GTO27_07840 [Candidatus Bathyarchaeota archaeon]|nr:hypothetical protein [Candidatus Bathyarchaeota archaeon]
MRWIGFARYHPGKDRPAQESVGEMANQSSYSPVVSSDIASTVRIATVIFPLLDTYHFLAGFGSECSINGKEERFTDIEFIS